MSHPAVAIQTQILYSRFDPWLHVQEGIARYRLYTSGSKAHGSNHKEKNPMEKDGPQPYTIARTHCADWTRYASNASPASPHPLEV